MPRLLTLLYLLLSTTVSAQESARLLQHATIIDGTGAAAYRGWLLLEGEQIADMGRGAAPRATGIEVVDLDGMTVMPGLADMRHPRLSACATVSCL